MKIVNHEQLVSTVNKAVAEVKVTDMHTHLFSEGFGDLLLYGVDELITYHYLIAENFRLSDISYEKFFSLSTREQADEIWKNLFVKNTPYSEACRGVLTVLNKLGVDTGERDLDKIRKQLAGIKTSDYIDRIFEISGVETVVMTNDPFDAKERKVWLSGVKTDPRFKAALRLDVLLNSWDSACGQLQEWGYDVKADFSGNTIAEVQRFLKEWVERMDALYVAVSLPSSFVMPEDSARGKLIEQCVIPVAKEKNIPFALMIGVKRGTNPQIKLAGDSLGRSDIDSVDYLCRSYPENKFMVTMLARENQHELCISARKFRNLMIFGCWWFLNNPSLIEEITRMRFELLGVSVVPQHSDARVLDQIVYKWSHSRKIIGKVLIDKYQDLMDAGWKLEDSDIQRDVAKLFGGNFLEFVRK